MTQAPKKPILTTYGALGGLTFCKTGFPTSGLAQHRGAAHTEHHCLRMAEHCGDLVASYRETPNRGEAHTGVSRDGPNTVG